MTPIGTRVTVKSVDHLGRFLRPRRLIGRTGVVVDHVNGMNWVGGLTIGKRVLRAFDDDQITRA